MTDYVYTAPDIDLGRTNENGFPWPERPGVPEDSSALRHYVGMVHDVAGFIAAVCAELRGKDAGNASVKLVLSPGRDRIPADGAMALQYCYGYPYAFHTPFGRVCMKYEQPDVKMADKLLAILTERLGLTEVCPARPWTPHPFPGPPGGLGPIYEIGKGLDGGVLSAVNPAYLSVYDGPIRSIHDGSRYPPEGMPEIYRLWNSIVGADEAYHNPRRSRGERSLGVARGSIADGPGG